VIELAANGLVVTEVAPGIDLQRDVLDQSDIALQVSPDLRLMHAALFQPEPFGLQLHPAASRGASAAGSTQPAEGARHD